MGDDALMGFRKYVLQDYSVNTTFKIRLLLFLFRLSCWVRLSGMMRYLLFFVPPFYRFLSDWLMSIDLPVGTTVGPRLRIFHGYSIVVGKGATIGADCIIRQGVTIGRKIDKDGIPSKDPVISDGVEFGAYSSVIGDVEVGASCRLGVGVSIYENLPPNSIVVAQKYRVIAGG